MNPSETLNERTGAATPAAPVPRPAAALPNITVAQLEYLVAAVDHATWVRAAESLGVSQSALSQGIAELQRRLGVDLFERHGRSRRLQRRAQPVVTHARDVLARTRALADWAERIRTGTAGRLRVGMIDAAAVDHFGRHLQEFRAERRGLDLHLSVAPSGELLAGLDRGDVDVVVCVAPESPRPRQSALIEEPLRVYAPTGAHGTPPHEWGPWVGFPTGSRTRRLIASALEARGLAYDIVAESHQPEVLKEMVHLGMGWTVLPPVQAERGPQPLEPVEIRPLLTRQLVAIVRDTPWTDAAASSLVDWLAGAAEGAAP